MCCVASVCERLTRCVCACVWQSSWAPSQNLRTGASREAPPPWLLLWFANSGPSFDARAVLLSIGLLLACPNPDDGLMTDIVRAAL